MPELDPRVEQIAESFDFFDLDTVKQLTYAADLGFLALRPEGHNASDAQAWVIGFATYISPEADEVHHPITDLADVPPEYAKADLLGKGAGTRIYSTEIGTTGLPGSHGADALFVIGGLRRERIMDMRRPSDKTMIGKALRIANHAGKLVQATMFGLSAMTERVHASYGNSQAALFSQPPNAARRQWLKSGPSTTAMPDNFLVLRDPTLDVVQIARRKPVQV